MYMSQINLHVSPEFAADLEALMKARGFKSKSEAIRTVIHESASQATPRAHNISVLIGLIDRLPGGPQTTKTSAELEAELDDEMEAKLERLARGS